MKFKINKNIKLFKKKNLKKEKKKNLKNINSSQKKKNKINK